VKGALSSVLATVAIVAGVGALFAWSPWASEERERERQRTRELQWVRAYSAWTTAIERRLVRGETVAGDACLGSLPKAVGPAPTDRLRIAASAARAACAEVGDPAAWRRSRWSVVRGLFEGHGEAAEAGHEPELSRTVAPIAGRTARAYCWPDRDWTPLAEQYSVVRGDELWLLGHADPARHRIDLAPEVCSPLDPFLRGQYPALLTLDSFELAQALVVLAHEAEHLRVPDASEAVVECYALQRVRGLLRAAGVGRAYEEEIVGLVMDVSYPRLPPEYRTTKCRDGGLLDLHPGSGPWP